MTAKTRLIAVCVAIGLLIIIVGVIAVKTMTSPSVRQVRLRSDSASAIHLSKALPWTVTFTDGTQATLIDVTDTPGKPTRWWAADGAVIAAPKPVPAAMMQDAPPGKKIYQFEVREISPQGTNRWLYVDVSAAGGRTASAASRYISGGPRMFGLAAELPQDMTQVDVSIFSPSAAPAVDWRYDVKHKPGAATTQPADVTIGKIFDQEGRVRVEVSDHRPLPDNAMVVLEVITGKGQRFGAVGMTKSQNGPTIYAFNAAAKDVVAVERTSRQLQIWTIHNVSLRPGETTDAKVESPTAAAMSRPAPAATTRATSRR